MKKKVLLSSIATIALCLCLIAGSTFALFTSQSRTTIAVTAGKVDMTAGIAITKLESVEGVNGQYVYKDVSQTFTNGGTAEVIGSILTLDRITPGDKVTFEISGTNDSNVAILYRYVITCEKGEELMKGLLFTVNGVAIDRYMESYTSPWTMIPDGSDITNIPITIELPVEAGNEFQEKETEIKVLVEAVQSNAIVEDNTAPVITYYNNVATAKDAAAAIADPYLPVVNITESLTDVVTVNGAVNKTVNVNGNDVDFVLSGNLNNLVITGITDTADENPSIQVLPGTVGTLTVKDSTLGTKNDNKTYGAIAGQGAAGLNVIVDNCDFVTNSANKSGIYFTALESLKVTNCTFTDFSSWAMNVNGLASGSVEIDNCDFTGCKGIVKILYGVDNDFTFTNNDMVDCLLKNDLWADVSPIGGDITVTGNTMTAAGTVTDADVTADDLLGVSKI